MQVDTFCEELLELGGFSLLLNALKWVPLPEKAGKYPSAQLLLDALLTLVWSVRHCHRYTHALPRITETLTSISLENRYTPLPTHTLSPVVT